MGLAADHWCQWCDQIVWRMVWSEDHRYMCPNCHYLTTHHHTI